MSDQPISYSLRSLFAATTVIALLFATTAVHPTVLTVSLLLLSPFLFVAAVVTCSRYSALATCVSLAIVGSAFVLGGISAATPITPTSDGNWILGSVLIAVGVALYICAAVRSAP
jgi:hypothetical protein